MSKFIVETINQLSEIYTSIQERVCNNGELLESDKLFIKFYKDFVDKAFNNKKENIKDEY
jgi:uncharacterized protein